MPLGMRLPELIIIFVIALLVFGPKKLPEMGASIGKSITAFKKSMKDITHDNEDENHLEQLQLEARRLELEVLEREIASKRAALATSEIAQSELSKDYAAPTNYDDAHAEVFTHPDETFTNIAVPMSHEAPVYHSEMPQAEVPASHETPVDHEAPVYHSERAQAEVPASHETPVSHEAPVYHSEIASTARPQAE